MFAVSLTYQLSTCYINCKCGICRTNDIGSHAAIFSMVFWIENFCYQQIVINCYFKIITFARIFMDGWFRDRFARTWYDFFSSYWTSNIWGWFTKYLEINFKLKFSFRGIKYVFNMSKGRLLIFYKSNK